MSLFFYQGGMCEEFGAYDKMIFAWRNVNKGLTLYKLVHYTSLNSVISMILFQMDIGYSGMKNEYLAAQGPLSDTCGDFWQVRV